jgi:quinate dehydrogenase (quinone)
MIRLHHRTALLGLLLGASAPLALLAQDAVEPPAEQTPLPTPPAVEEPAGEGAAPDSDPASPAETPVEAPAAPGGAVDPGYRGAAMLPESGDWVDWGRDMGGSRFVPHDQITPENVGDLEVAWTFRTGGAGPNQATPLQVGGTLYVCTRDNRVFALDAETGEEIWRFDPVLTDLANGGGCRGVSFYQASAGEEACASRIITSTRDARLLAVDARTGERCSGFGTDGEVDLRTGMGPDEAGFQYNTSPAKVVADMIVVGAGIFDGQSVEEPSGVVRAYDATDGSFRWAWDMGRPGVNTEPAEGETYTRGTPNVWSVMSADPELGLIYLPLGNATPDYYGGHRTPEMEEFASSLVALNVADGSVAWHFQTTHHDIWDYDVASQPVLVDFPGPDGPIPAVVQPTKRGELFVFDRATGEPLTEIEERPVPQGAVEGDWTAETQPFSVGMPRLGANHVEEADMWGLTPIDQLLCRLQFRRSNYEGTFTPPSDEAYTVFTPGYFGGSNWGSVSFDPDRRILVGTSVSVPNRMRLIPTDAPEAAPFQEVTERGMPVIGPGVGAPQRGTPYVQDGGTWLSPLGVPCTRPPFGQMTAIDMETQEVLWERPIGTARNGGPFGLQLGLDIEMGMPLNGGSLVTGSGLIFFAGSQDGYFRALSTETGEELWRVDMPTGATATPMSYLGAESGDQFVAVTAGGTFQTSERGDYIIAYRLPR